jgi:hypothetical protein
VSNRLEVMLQLLEDQRGIILEKVRQSPLPTDALSSAVRDKRRLDTG